MVIESAIMHTIKKEIDVTNKTSIELSNELFDKSNEVVIYLLQSLE